MRHGCRTWSWFIHSFIKHHEYAGGICSDADKLLLWYLYLGHTTPTPSIFWRKIYCSNQIYQTTRVANVVKISCQQLTKTYQTLNHISKLKVMDWIDAMSWFRIAWGFGMSAYQNSWRGSERPRSHTGVVLSGHPRVLVGTHAKPPSYSKLKVCFSLRKGVKISENLTDTIPEWSLVNSPCSWLHDRTLWTSKIHTSLHWSTSPQHDSRVVLQFVPQYDPYHLLLPSQAPSRRAVCEPSHGELWKRWARWRGAERTPLSHPAMGRTVWTGLRDIRKSFRWRCSRRVFRSSFWTPRFQRQLSPRPLVK